MSVSTRPLKFHEAKLLKKHGNAWKGEARIQETAVMRRYHVGKRDDYIKYDLDNRRWRRRRAAAGAATATGLTLLRASLAGTTRSAVW